MRSLVTGGAGFIGSHLVHRLIQEREAFVTVYDNFSSGREWHLADLEGSSSLLVVRADIEDLGTLTNAMRGQERVFHLASNPDIAKAMVDPTIDFWQGTYLTQNVLEAMRLAAVRKLVYSSGSGVYGDAGLTRVSEDYAPMQPISTYGASKLAGEALVSAYTHLFGIGALVFRFANVVGPRQTHGVAYDFIRQLRENPGGLKILGDGSQSKSYIHVDDVVDAMLLAIEHASRPFECYNVATDDYVTVDEIAEMVIEIMGLSRDEVEIAHSGGERGWKGDVPIVRFDLTKIHSLGWAAKSTAREAMRDSIRCLLDESGGQIRGHD